MSSLANALSEFTSAIASILVGLFNSVIAVFSAVFALGKDLIGGVYQLGQSFIKLGLDVFQGVLGFATANFLALAVIGGGYYYYTTQYKNKRGGKKRA